MKTTLAGAVAAWLWAGVMPADVPPPTVQTIYVFQGVIAERAGVASVQHLGVHPHAGDARAIVPVVHFAGQPTPERVARELEALARRGRRVDDACQWFRSTATWRRGEWASMRRSSLACARP